MVAGELGCVGVNVGGSKSMGGLVGGEGWAGWVWAGGMGMWKLLGSVCVCVCVNLCVFNVIALHISI